MADETDLVFGASELKALEELVRRSGDGGKYGLTEAGFAPKPYTQLLRESLAAARAVLGPDIDLAPGSAVRKILELGAIETTRTYATMAAVVDDLYIPTASGPALSRLGEELGVPRPFMRASGELQLTLEDHADAVRIPRGARLTSLGGDRHVFTLNEVELSTAAKTATVRAQAFYPGLDGNLDPGDAAQKITLWNDSYTPSDDLDRLADLRARALAANVRLEEVVSIQHETRFTGGEARWPDESYRELLLRMPRSVWTPEAIQAAVSMVPGVRRVAVQDQYGGLDLNRAIFGDFNFLERLFAAERDLISPYAFSILVAQEDGAIWGGPGGLLEAVLEAVEDLRPIGLFPRVERAATVHVFVRATVHVRGLPLPSGNRTAMNQSPPARAFKARLLERIDSYVGALGFDSPVRASKVEYQIMSDPNVVDVLDLELLHGSGASLLQEGPQGLGVGRNLDPIPRSVPVLVDTDEYITLVPAP
ncbi:baseplate J/gp47 family protein [Phenylobacterium terrae]|uniref:Baseplate J/gp47 family protein n=1 Tax=Phenylobacterium terrae TaxID=2665495 RepID=A0ABW4MW35_9CAUL